MKLPRVSPQAPQPASSTSSYQRYFTHTHAHTHARPHALINASHDDSQRDEARSRNRNRNFHISPCLCHSHGASTDRRRSSSGVTKGIRPPPLAFFPTLFTTRRSRAVNAFNSSIHHGWRRSLARRPHQGGVRRPPRAVSVSRRVHIQGQGLYVASLFLSHTSSPTPHSFTLTFALTPSSCPPIHQLDFPTP